MPQYKDRFGRPTDANGKILRGAGAQEAAEESKINNAGAGGLGAVAARARAARAQASPTPEAEEPKAEERAESAIDRQLRLRREAKEKATPYPKSR